MMDRRQMLYGGMSIALAGPALAGPVLAETDQPSSAAATGSEAASAPALAPVKNSADLWYLLVAMNSLIFVLSTAVLKENKVVYQSLGEFQPYSTQLSDNKGVDAFNSALKSDDGQSRAKAAADGIKAAGAQISKLIDGVVSEQVRTSLVDAFERASMLLTARAETNASWWCHVYAFRKVDC